MAGTIGVEPMSPELTAPRSAIELHAKNKVERMARVELAIPAWKAVTAHADTRSIVPELLNNSGDGFRGGVRACSL
jgi:hypothetical protein